MSRPSSRNIDAGEEKTTAGLSLGYGRGWLPFRFETDRFQVLSGAARAECEASDADIEAALDSPIDSGPLENLVHAHDRVLIVVPDATRAAGADRIATHLVARLNRLGLSDAHLAILIGGGIHRAPTRSEIRAILGEQIPERVEVLHHDALDAAASVELGTTQRGTPVEINRRLTEADRVLLVGAITFHYFAGFSAGRKAMVPGCSTERAIRANHLLAFDSATWSRATGVESGRLIGNPVHEDMEEAVAMLPPTFLVNTTMTAANQIGRVYAGHWQGAHRRGCSDYLASHAVDADGKRQIVVVGCGGAPRDVNLIQAHKAMEHASKVLEDGGTMIVVAECAQGLGRDDFLDWFVPGGARATAAKLMGGDYRVNGQTAWALRAKTERFRVRLVSSLDPSLVRRMGMEPMRSLDEAVADAPDARGYVLPGGSTTLPRLAFDEVGPTPRA